MNDMRTPLMGDENTMDLLDVRRMVTDFKVPHVVLERVLSEDLIDRVMSVVERNVCAAQIPAGGTELLEEDGRTEVYFWGMKGAGKTTVIGSVLAAQPEGTKKVNEGAALSRCESLCNAFAQTGTDTIMPEVADSEDWDVINTNIKDKDGRTHPLALVEMNGMSVSKDVLKETENDKIHILCYDCSNAGVVQDNMFINLLNELRKEGALDYSVGVYLLVTKIDTLTSVPEDYRAELAQTMMTADHIDLWMAVENTCHAMEISDAAPVPFSIGEVKLQRLVKVDLTHARNFMERVLALKSMPYRSWIGKLLETGSWWTTALAVLAAGAVLLYLAFGVLRMNQPLPKEAILPLDYCTYFTGEVESRIKGGAYFKVVDNFRALEDELKIEQKIELKGGKRLMRMHEYAECKRVLYDTFSDVVRGGMEYEFRGNAWSESTLYRLQTEARKIMACRYLSEDKRNEMKEACQVVSDYFLAKELVDLSQNCYTLDDVEDIKSRVAQYDREPLNNSDKVRQWLKQALENAENSDVLAPTLDDNFDFR